MLRRTVVSWLWAIIALLCVVSVLGWLLVAYLMPLKAQAADHCPPLPPASGNVVNVSTVAQLVAAVNQLTPHTTILLPGSAVTYTATVDDLGGTVYLALKTRNAEGTWSALSNNAFWLRQDLFLPVVVRGS